MRRSANLRYASKRSGFTLIEALVAVTITLIMMLALSKGFVMMSQSVSDGRAKLNLSDQLRGVANILREDLDGITAGGDPMSAACRSGYFEYYEGPLNDYTATLLNFDSTQENIEQKIPASRYGDFDDIVAFTVKAKKGRWFYGEVPYPMVMGPIHLAANAAGASLPVAFSADEWAQTVTVASDTAEIVYFMMPHGADRDRFVADATGLTDFAKVHTAGNQHLIEDTDLNQVPDRMMLCRRVLLVLPDLNLPAGTLVAGRGTTIEPTLFHQDLSNANGTTQLQAAPLGAPGSPNAVNHRIGMQVPYQRCDLSVRRVSDGDPSTLDPIAANTLSDLQDPRNRFAHTILPAGGSNTTLPLWSLSGPIPLQNVALTAAGSLNWFGASLAATGAGELPEVGFLLPQFMRQRRVDRIVSGTTPTENQILYEVAFSEVLANNCVGFDIRGYDATAPVLYHPGVDDTTGLSGGVDPTFFGAVGSDDVALTPSDPGYSSAIQLMLDGMAANSTEPYIARRGAFVDASWPLTTRAQAVFITNNPNRGQARPWANIAANTAVPELSSNLSLTVPGTSFTNLLPTFTAQAVKSGKVVIDGTNAIRVYQPGFDTFTSRYESDGYLQGPVTGFGSLWVNGQHQYHFPSNQVPTDSTILPDLNADLGNDGVDNNLLGGVDDLTEQETSPVVASPMKAIQILIRVEDKGASAIQQVAVTHELRLEN